MIRRTATFHVFDPLYGSIRLPNFLREFLASPEFQRLCGVRLLNCDSIELAALSEVRRRSHTLGVLHLATRLTLLEFGSEDIKALLIAIVMHDIGTPPFGHSVEYEYIRRLGLDHEGAATRILDGRHHTLSYDHQIYGGRAVQLHSLVEKADRSGVTRSILAGTHPLSTLIFGDLDLDNLDNVYRMAWYLGERCDVSKAVRLASLIEVDAHGNKYLSEEHRYLVEEWARLRRLCYGALFDSSLHRQRQAIFSRIIFESMEHDTDVSPLISEEDWFLTDEEILNRLRRDSNLKSRFADFDREALLPEIQYEFELDARLSRSAVIQHRDAITARLLNGGAFSYVTMIPYGEALERRVEFLDRAGDERWWVGSPRHVYRVCTYLASASMSRDLAAQKLNVQGKLEEYFDENGWSRHSFRSA